MDTDCVIIGVNAQATLAKCIQSVLKSYLQGKIHVCYVDGGSGDNSVAIARSFPQVHVIEITPEFPTPGMGRNAGWRSGSSEMVQFLDSDTILDPAWLSKAAEAMKPGVGAMRGHRVELNPDASVWNWIGNLEWNCPAGECDSFGGDVLIPRTVLEETGGYDEILVAGEDPELSRRIRQQGWKIIQLDELMCGHDLGMTRFIQYWKRSYRTGYGFSALAIRSSTFKDGHVRKCLRVLGRGGGSVCLGLAGLIGMYWNAVSLFLFISAVLLLFFPRIFRISHLMAEKQLSAQDAKRYAWHCSVVMIPQFFGIMRFFTGWVSGKPLRNRYRVLKTRVSPGKEII